MLTLYRRHKKTCVNFSLERHAKQRACNCMFWADGVLAGREIRLSLKTRDSKKAAEIVHKMDATESLPAAGAPVTLAHAWESIISDLEARKLSFGTIRKYKLLKRHMTDFGKERGLSLLAQFDLDTLGRFRQTWKEGPRTASKKLERLRAFFRFCFDRQWTDSNPATRIRLPKVQLSPTMPLTSADMTKILAACEKLELESQPHGRVNARRLKTLVLLMRYTGIRVSDAVTLTTDRLDGKKIFLYTAKTGTPVYTVLPESVRLALEATPLTSGNRFFWTGNGKRETAICDWQMRMKSLFDLAGISKGSGNAISHRFRDTFAVELLLAGVPIERVSILLGHQSVRITEKHYSPWVRSRQEQLEADVTAAWLRDPMLTKTETTGTNQGHTSQYKN
jgi:integrase/recombinase XerD